MEPLTFAVMVCVSNSRRDVRELSCPRAAQAASIRCARYDRTKNDVNIQGGELAELLLLK